jgi:hypothetical protein
MKIMMELIALTPMYEGEQATFTINGKKYTRVVRYRQSDGLYVVVDNTEYYEYEFEVRYGEQ